jgi:hypothetical protein
VRDILDRLILAGGPARSGTTLLAKLLNAHPQIVTAVDTVGAHESWALYYYPWEIGLVQELRGRALTSQQVQAYLLDHLIKDGELWGVAPSEKVTRYPEAGPAIHPDPPPDLPIYNRPPPPFTPTLVWRIRRAVRNRFRHKPPPKTPQQRPRYRVPVDRLRDEWRLCLKSPEISFVLPQLAAALPGAQFIIVHRPVTEIAESMYRKGFEWGPPYAYHKRWEQAVSPDGRAIPPPGVPEVWHDRWQTATAFQRCVMYAASYMRAIALDVPRIAPGSVFVYDHTLLRTEPQRVMLAVAAFLQVAVDGFAAAHKTIRDDVPVLAADLQREYDTVRDTVEVAHWEEQIAALDGVV